MSSVNVRVVSWAQLEKQSHGIFIIWESPKFRFSIELPSNDETPRDVSVFGNIIFLIPEFWNARAPIDSILVSSNLNSCKSLVSANEYSPIVINFLDEGTVKVERELQL